MFAVWVWFKVIVAGTYYELLIWCLCECWCGIASLGFGGLFDGGP